MSKAACKVDRDKDFRTILIFLRLNWLVEDAEFFIQVSHKPFMLNSDFNPDVRWRILGLSCLVLFGQYFCYDIPAVVHDHLSTYSGVAAQDFPWYFNSLYSAYSLPNLILPLAFGYIVDKSSGSRIVQVLATSTCVGQLLVTLGMIRFMHYHGVS